MAAVSSVYHSCFRAPELTEVPRAEPASLWSRPCVYLPDRQDQATPVRGADCASREARARPSNLKPYGVAAMLGTVLVHPDARVSRLRSVGQVDHTVLVRLAGRERQLAGRGSLGEQPRTGPEGE